MFAINAEHPVVATQRTELQVSDSFETDKHASLFIRSFGDEEDKAFKSLTPVANVLKHFTAVSYDFS